MANAAWHDLLLATQTGMQALGLTAGGVALPAAQHYVRKVVTDRNTMLPFVMAAQGGRERYEPGTFEDIEVSYPVLVGHVFASNQDYALNGDLLTWRQKIIDMVVEFEQTIRPNVPTAEVTGCEIETEVAVDTSLFKDANLDVGGILLWFRTLRRRSR